MELYDLIDICKMFLGIARTCGIQVVKDLDAKEYAQFLIDRKTYEEDFKKELDAIKEAKMLRTT